MAVKPFDIALKPFSFEPEPVKMSWLTDFKLICLDGEILVIKECLINSSKVFKAALENETSDFLNLEWKSSVIVEVMKAIHVFPGYSFQFDFRMKDRSLFERNKDMLEFCFKYDIEPLLTKIKVHMNETITSVGADSRWIPIFHQWKNKNKTEPFEEQINAMRLSVINNYQSIENYFFEGFNYHNEDMIEDYRFIIKGLILRLERTENYLHANEAYPNLDRFKITIKDIERDRKIKAIEREERLIRK